MMRSVGYEVYHYGVEGSQSGATVQETLLSRQEWETLRIASYLELHPDQDPAQVTAKLSDPTAFVGDLANRGTPLYRVFNERMKAALRKNFRSSKTDLLCMPFGRTHLPAMEGLGIPAVESGIGYMDSFHGFRIFESYAWMHHTLGTEKKSGQSYWFVAPNYFDVSEWPLYRAPAVPKRVGFFGRICHIKGMAELVEVARRMPEVEFVMCGQGDPAPYCAKAPNLKYEPPIHGAARAAYLGGLAALVAPSKFIEPFCGVNVEAQLCGTPVICHDFGAFAETVEQGRTGVRCHTLEDFCHGVRLALAGHFDREYIRTRAVRKYDMYNVARQYDYIFRCIMDVQCKTINGWYSPNTHLPLALVDGAVTDDA
jgi:glycosyltransferase involved in cell wall biosynthesis